MAQAVDVPLPGAAEDAQLQALPDPSPSPTPNDEQQQKSRAPSRMMLKSRQGSVQQSTTFTANGPFAWILEWIGKLSERMPDLQLPAKALSRGFITLQQLKAMLRLLPEDEVIAFNKLADNCIQEAVGTVGIQEDQLKIKLNAFLSKYKRFANNKVDQADAEERRRATDRSLWILGDETLSPAYIYIPEEMDRKNKAATAIQRAWRKWNAYCQAYGRPAHTLDRDLRRARYELRIAYERASVTNSTVTSRGYKYSISQDELMDKYRSLMMADAYVRKITARDQELKQRKAQLAKQEAERALSRAPEGKQRVKSVTISKATEQVPAGIDSPKDSETLSPRKSEYQEIQDEAKQLVAELREQSAHLSKLMQSLSRPLFPADYEDDEDENEIINSDANSNSNSNSDEDDHGRGGSARGHGMLSESGSDTDIGANVGDSEFRAFMKRYKEASRAHKQAEWVSRTAERAAKKTGREVSLPRFVKHPMFSTSQDCSNSSAATVTGRHYRVTLTGTGVQADMQSQLSVQGSQSTLQAESKLKRITILFNEGQPHSTRYSAHDFPTEQDSPSALPGPPPRMQPSSEMRSRSLHTRAATTTDIPTTQPHTETRKSSQLNTIAFDPLADLEDTRQTRAKPAALHPSYHAALTPKRRFSFAGGFGARASPTASTDAAAGSRSRHSRHSRMAETARAEAAIDTLLEVAGVAAEAAEAAAMSQPAADGARTERGSRSRVMTLRESMNTGRRSEPGSVTITTVTTGRAIHYTRKSLTHSQRTRATAVSVVDREASYASQKGKASGSSETVHTQDPAAPSPGTHPTHAPFITQIDDDGELDYPPNSNQQSTTAKTTCDSSYNGLSQAVTGEYTLNANTTHPPAKHGQQSSHAVLGEGSTQRGDSMHGAVPAGLMAVRQRPERPAKPGPRAAQCLPGTIDTALRIDTSIVSVSHLQSYRSPRAHSDDHTTLHGPGRPGEWEMEIGVAGSGVGEAGDAGVTLPRFPPHLRALMPPSAGAFELGVPLAAPEPDPPRMAPLRYPRQKRYLASINHTPPALPPSKQSTATTTQGPLSPVRPVAEATLLKATKLQLAMKEALAATAPDTPTSAQGSRIPSATQRPSSGQTSLSDSPTPSHPGSPAQAPAMSAPRLDSSVSRVSQVVSATSSAPSSPGAAGPARNSMLQLLAAQKRLQSGGGGSIGCEDVSGSLSPGLKKQGTGESSGYRPLLPTLSARRQT